MATRTARALGLLSALSLCTCTGNIDDNASGPASGAGPTSGATVLSGAGATGAGATGSATTSSGTGASGGGSATGGGGSGPVDPCANAAFCETFEDYSGVTALDDQQKFGPWRAALKAGAVMNLDGAHTVSGANALHTHIDQDATSGGRLFTNTDLPILAGNPTHLYGRMMMYIDPNGTSIHWTFFGVSGDAEPSSPAVGRNASYIMSSLPKNGVNTYSFVYGLSASGNDPYHDCSLQSDEPMPTAGWTCVSFEMDSVARKLRMYADGGANPIASVDDHGKGCVGSVPVDSPWYGPAIDQFFVGAWSFHPMNAPLDVWIDDLVLDTAPVACPVQ